MKHVDIWSKGEVVSFLNGLATQGQIKNCANLAISKGHAGAFYPRCEKDWASWKEALNVDIDCTAYHGPSSYSWPVCSPDCPKFKAIDNLIQSLDPDDQEMTTPTPGTKEKKTNRNKPPQTANHEMKEAEILIDGKPIQELIAAKIDLDSKTHELPYPDKVTLAWLRRHVPWNIWSLFCSLLVAAFLFGFKLGKIDFFVTVYKLLTN